jgi:metallophosphoesterase (TIGR03767 family)
MDRRDFLKATGLFGAAAMVPGTWMRWADAATRSSLLPQVAELTTLGRTIVKGEKIGEGSLGAYYRLAYGAGEPHLRRTELAEPGPGSNRRAKPKDSLLSIAHFTDIHLVDAQSPARVEFLDRFADPGQGCESVPFASAHRPQETLTLHILEAMIRQTRDISISPITGKPIATIVCTGDNIDNEQFNELRWFIDLMDGDKEVSPNSGEGAYEGVQAAEWADPEYWHPEPGVADKYKQQFGFPEYPGLLDDAIKPFTATGAGIPWLQTFGNHDGLMQGNAPRNDLFDRIAIGGFKPSGLPPGVNPCDAFQTLRDNPTAFAAAPVHPVSADPNRKILTRAEYIEEMFNTTGSPVGHGLTEDSRSDGVAYWHNDEHADFRLIGLDTVNPGGFESGSIGATQFAWLEQKLIEVSSVYFDADGNEASNDVQDRYVVLFSHHGLRSLDNPVATPNPLDPGSNDLPRMLADEVEALVHRFPNVIAWVNGHSHTNIVEPRPSTSGGGFWDIGTAAHIDWSCQSRLLDVVDNQDGTLSIFGTMVDHAAPAVPGAESDAVLRLASISREVAANDFQSGFASSGPGEANDRNVELLIKAPFRAKPKKDKARALASA